MTNKWMLALAAAVGLGAVLVGAFGTGLVDTLFERASLPATAPAESEIAARPVEGTPSSSNSAIANRVVPSFDLVRVEPTGDAVIAGQGAPNVEVEILSGGGVIASGKANAAGEWAIVLTDPLKAGAHDLTVRTKGADGATLTSEQSVAVSVPEGGQGEVLVVLNQPGIASTVLQIPGQDEADRALAEAAGDPAAEQPEVAASGEAVPSSGGSAEVAAAPAVAGEAPAAPPSDGETALNATPSAAPEAPAAAAPASEAPAEVATAPETPAAPGAAAPAPSQLNAAAPESTAPDAAEAPSASAAAGGGETPEASNPEPSAEVTPAPAESPPAESAGAGNLPAPPEITEPAAPAAPAALAESTAQAPTAEPAAPAPEVEAPRVSVEAVELENGERFYAAGAAVAGTTVRLYVNDALAAETQAMANGRWLVETPLRLDPGQHRVRVDQVARDGSVAARAEVPFEITSDLEAPIAVSGSGSAAAGSGIAGEARIGDTQTLIIRRGDNLWRIARRLYGLGMRYSTIYEANSDQIVNPDLIFPGQVFVIPKGDRNWPADEAAAQPTQQVQ